MICGRTVCLDEPFPPQHWESLYEWLNGYSLISSADCFPKDRELFRKQLESSLSGMRSWGVVSRETGALVGALIFEPFGTMGAKTYVASRRAVWGKGLIDEAGRMAIDEVFGSDPSLQYIMGFVVANNAPAKAYNLRLGLTLKNVLLGHSEQLGKKRDLHIYEMTRRDWERCRHARHAGDYNLSSSAA